MRSIAVPLIIVSTTTIIPVLKPVIKFLENPIRNPQINPDKMMSHPFLVFKLNPNATPNAVINPSAILTKAILSSRFIYSFYYGSTIF